MTWCVEQATNAAGVPRAFCKNRWFHSLAYWSCGNCWCRLAKRCELAWTVHVVCYYYVEQIHSPFFFWAGTNWPFLHNIYKYLAPLESYWFQLVASLSSIVIESINTKRLEEDGRSPRVSLLYQFLTRNRMRQLAEAESQQIFRIDEFGELHLNYAAYFWRHVDLAQSFHRSAYKLGWHILEAIQSLVNEFILIIEQLTPTITMSSMVRKQYNSLWASALLKKEVNT